MLCVVREADWVNSRSGFRLALSVVFFQIILREGGFQCKKKLPVVTYAAATPSDVHTVVDRP